MDHANGKYYKAARMRSKTSVEAYETVEANGMLSRARFAVYDCVFRYGPMTRNQIDEVCAGKDNKNPTYSRRLVEMEHLGVLCRRGTMVCPIKGTNCTAWDVTDRLPLSPHVLKRPRVRDIIRDLAAGGPYFDLEGECVFCEAHKRSPEGHLATCIWVRAKAWQEAK